MSNEKNIETIGRDHLRLIYVHLSANAVLVSKNMRHIQAKEKSSSILTFLLHHMRPAPHGAFFSISPKIPIALDIGQENRITTRTQK